MRGNSRIKPTYQKDIVEIDSIDVSVDDGKTFWPVFIKRIPISAMLAVFGWVIPSLGAEGGTWMTPEEAVAAAVKYLLAGMLFILPFLV